MIVGQEAQQDDVVKPPPKVNWNLLELEDNRVVRTATLELYASSSVPEKQGLLDKHFVCEIRDRKTAMLLSAFLTKPLRRAIDYRLLGPPHYPLGRLALVTQSNERITITITWAGFVLGTDEAEGYNVFFSYGVAKVIDDLLFAQRGIHLSRKIRCALSAENLAEHAEERYESISRWYDEHPEENTPTTKPGGEKKPSAGSATPAGPSSKTTPQAAKLKAAG